MASRHASSNRKPTNKSRAVEYVSGLPFYPQYCFKRSPTINTYCHLQIADINALTLLSGFGGQNVFFRHNHPVKWVRIAGIVVAVDDFAGHRTYTIDDSSGVCIECTVDVPKSEQQRDLLAALEATTPAAAIIKGTTSAASEQAKATVPFADIDVGTILDIKGGLALFRGNKQIKILKATILRCTQQEMAFWDKVTQFRHDVLDKAWYLSDKDVRRCRKDEERRR